MARMRLLAVAVAACLWQAPVLGQEAADAFPVPDLVGTWVGPYSVIRSNGFADGVLELRVVEQEGPLLKVEKAWKVARRWRSGRCRRRTRHDGDEPLVGVIGFDGREIQLAEQGDEGIYSGRLVDPDTIELLYIESDRQATAYRVRLTRTD